MAIFDHLPSHFQNQNPVSQKIQCKSLNDNMLTLRNKVTRFSDRRI